MSLRGKFISILILLFLTLGLVNFLTEIIVIYPAFKSLDIKNAESNAIKLKSYFKKEIKSLEKITKDWAFWDDTYNFILDNNSSYINSNLVVSSFLDLKINLIEIIRNNGEVLWKGYYDFSKNKLIKNFNLLSKNDFFKIIKKYKRGISGFYKMDDKIYILSIMPVLKSDYSGKINGYLIMSKELNKEFFEKMKKDFRLNFEYSFKKIMKKTYIPIYFTDIFSNKVLWIYIPIKNNVRNLGKQVIVYSAIIYIILALIIIVAISSFLNRLIVEPVIKIEKFLDTISKNLDSEERINVIRKDEIGVLIDKINYLLDSLKTYKENLDLVTEKLIEDIQKRMEAEKRLREAEKRINRLKRMESLALLAGGVAHDLNNILTGIVNFPEILLKDNSLSEKNRKIILKIKQAGKRAVEIVSDLLTITRGIKIKDEKVNINEVVKEVCDSPEVLNFLKEKREITLKKNLYENLWLIKGSKIHLYKAILNLVINAIEAIEKRGIIEISTENITLNKPLQKFMVIPKGDYVKVKVCDNGKGIPQEIIERVFEPFFTTKKDSKKSGTGLGLFIVWNTVTSHNGYIDIESNREGTTFTLYFPALKTV